MIILADGLYSGAGNKNLDFSSKAILIRSENGPENCIIDCEQTSAGVVFYSNESRNSVLSGFTIINGTGTNIESVDQGENDILYGGAVSKWNTASPTIDNCILRDNTAQYGAESPFAIWHLL